MSRTTGETGVGQIEGATFGNSGRLTFQFADETYVGNWVTVRDPGAQGFGLFNASTSDGTLFGTSSIFAESDSGYGNAILRSDQGNSMRCEFRYSLVTITAIGVCQRNDGEIFDLQVS
ncbi:hypothetical protein GTF97_10645 [Roseobacter sp. HKCCD8767]|nr:MULTISPECIES: hypothetical protein [unclassified Roseobacter]NNV68192.1 hypothetical protein [Roseobacter sp. HKCCD8474]NNV93900.1 hypothetical protein [Roseobacter sp. HKCCD8914]NNW10774.1 hypothetical protein [Roseobacter sp. HKCCD8484]NNW19294.1 hypothetical protein [Roseobacter sp. HKCCD7543]NNW44867.1 hypothetical protein [Roseobacter sp. HKCCD8291]NNW78991.1 hypothetical protein [Roseobacter sp. HKCCD8134]NNW87508.1 hypothetical protein [Roseobacter sp. HKCCD8272]NNX21703.1 hypothe